MVLMLLQVSIESISENLPRNPLRNDAIVSKTAISDIFPDIILVLLQKINTVNLLWAFQFASTEVVGRDPDYPLQHDDFLPVRFLSSALDPSNLKVGSSFRASQRALRPFPAHSGLVVRTILG